MRTGSQDEKNIAQYMTSPYVPNFIEWSTVQTEK